MSSQKRKFPKTFIEVENKVSEQSLKLPFYVKKFGYSGEKKFEIGDGEDHNDILILYSLTSVVQFSHQQDLQYLTAYDLVISSCHSPLRFNTVGAAKWNFFYVIINGSHAKYYYNLIRTKYNIIRVNPLSRVTDIFINIANIEFKGSTLSNMRLSVLIHDLLCELYEISCDVIECKNLIPVQDTDVNNAINYIKNHYKDVITIDSLCNQVCLSKYYFCKIFKKHTGVSIHQYINEYRINKSKELLSYSKLSINGVAAAVGFTSTLTYIRTFEKFVRMTPSEYRKNF